LKPSGLLSEIKGQTIFCGEINTATAALIKKMFKSQAVLPSPAGQLRRAAFLAELAQQRRAAQDYDDLAAFQPLYLRRPPITERKKA
jgi:tRNA A37 threonylcarbamoyladenosine modification protein TsaB